jgi:RNA polymerase sigma factor (sigma-70 family)
MDSMLRYLLDSQDEVERKRRFDEIILVHTAPLVRGILGERLGFYLNPAGKSRGNPEAEDLYHQIMLKLIQRLSDLQADPEKYAINDYRQYVGSVATNECHSHLRRRSLARARLKNNLRMLISRRKEFKIWKLDDRTALCGFAAWEGRAISTASSERLARLKETPETFTSARFANEDPQRVPHTKLLVEILQWLGGPVEIDDLVELVAMFRHVQDQPAESIESAEEQQGLQLTDPTPRSDVTLENKEMVRKLWEEVKQLPPNYRIAFCLGPVGEENDDLWDLLLTAEVITLTELAAGLEISFEKLVEIWGRLPMDSKTMAEYLGATRSQVKKWRFRAVERLRERLGGKK